MNRCEGERSCEEPPEVRVDKTALGGCPSCGVVNEHALEQIQACLVEARHSIAQRSSGPLGEAILVVGQLLYSWPNVVSGGAERAKDFKDLVNLGVTWEERMSQSHLGKDAADGPHVDGGAVVSRAQQHFGRTVPERYNFVGIGAERDTKGTGETKVGELEVTFAVDEKVLRLQVAVEDAVCVAVVKTANELIGELANDFGTHTVASAVSRDMVHVLAQVKIEELKDEVQPAFLVNNVEQPANKQGDQVVSWHVDAAHFAHFGW